MSNFIIFQHIFAAFGITEKIFIRKKNKVQVCPTVERLRSIDALYNKVRNYVTQKPYSNDKIKLNFQNPQLLGGWDKNKERDYRCVLLRKNSLYYLAIMDKSSNRIFEDFPEVENSSFEKIDYKLLPDPSKMLPKVFFANNNKDLFEPSESLLISTIVDN